MVSWGVEAPTYIASLAEMDWTKQRARRFSRDVSRDEPRPAKIAALAEQDSRPASVRAAERAAARPNLRHGAMELQNECDDFREITY